MRGTFSTFAGIGLMARSVAGHILGTYMLMAGLPIVVLALFPIGTMAVLLGAAVILPIRAVR